MTGRLLIEQVVSGASPLAAITEAKGGVILTPQVSKQGNSVCMSIGGKVGGIELTGEVRPFHLHLEKQVTMRAVESLTTVNRADGSGKDIPPTVKRKVLQAVFEKLQEFMNDR